MQSVKKCVLVSIVLGLLGHVSPAQAAYSHRNSWRSAPLSIANERLLQAANDGDEEGVRKALEEGVNVVEPVNGNTVLHVAKTVAVAQILVEAKADVNARNWGWGGLSPLCWHKNNAEMVQFLLAHEAQIDVADDTDRTILHGCNSCEAIDMLLQAGAPLDTRTIAKDTVLHSTSINSHVLRHLLNRGAGKFINSVNSLNETPLLHHLFFGSSGDVICVLIEGKADVNGHRSWSGNRPIHLARTGAIAKLLIENKADVISSKDNGNTPLHSARSKEVVRVLLNAAPLLLEARNSQGQTPLHAIAVRAGVSFEAKDGAVTGELLACGADVEAKDNDNKSILQAVVEAADRQYMHDNYELVIAQLINAWAARCDMSRIKSASLKEFIEQTFEEREEAWGVLWHGSDGSGVLRASFGGRATS